MQDRDEVTLEEACSYWNLEQSEVNYIVSKFEGKSYWQNNRTLEVIHIHNREAFKEMTA